MLIPSMLSVDMCYGDMPQPLDHVTSMSNTTLCRSCALPWYALSDIGSMPPLILGHSIVTYASEHGMGWEEFVAALREDSRHNNALINALANLTVFVMTKLVAESEVNARIIEWEQIKNAEWSIHTAAPRTSKRTCRAPQRYSDTWA
jgi:hypothetical protein